LPEDGYPYLRIDSLGCGECALGRLSDHGRGGACPFIANKVGADELVAEKGADATHVWWVKDGAVAVGEGEGEGEPVQLRLPGSFVGLEALVSRSYRATARSVTATSLCGATREGFERWVGQSPERGDLLVEAAASMESAGRKKDET